MEHKIVIGIDQSYADSGITVGLDGKIKTITDCYTDKLHIVTGKQIGRASCRERVLRLV